MRAGVKTLPFLAGFTSCSIDSQGNSKMEREAGSNIIYLER